MVYSLFRTVWPQIAFPATGCVQIGTSRTGVLRVGLSPDEIGGSHLPKLDNRRRLTPAPAAARLRGSVDLIVQRGGGVVPHLEKRQWRWIEPSLKPTFGARAMSFARAKSNQTCIADLTRTSLTRGCLCWRDRLRLSLELIAAPTVRATPASSPQERCTKNIPRPTACVIWPGVDQQHRT